MSAMLCINRLFRRRSKKTPKLRVAGLCEGNLPVTGEFPAQRASNTENVSNWWRHHFVLKLIDRRLNWTSWLTDTRWWVVGAHDFSNWLNRIFWSFFPLHRQCMFGDVLKSIQIGNMKCCLWRALYFQSWSPMDSPHKGSVMVFSLCKLEETRKN